ncbi:MAG: T9SS type A sorting domain-containing protein [Ignavibacteriota bacterium]|nr:T9SS type A sorting domain-containing protein [Ignavibacteriales bacterium]MBL1121434.1 T9SS C-terminal target domain-containing protein [Ignavibacteriota bacterium]MCE7857556.1 T9SS C-terminal target domain-containing protein [Ignavibacteria bacterium CHB3]GJQ42292.1 MAG: hypothetical protein JETCAE03_17900 [Ignavibacteriaceae bacterium]QKJ97132.1 MAG: T9SS type A sorting domain-containing protein [Ignavibacteriota bacterium]
MKTIKYFFCILLLIFTSRIYSQVPDTIWTKTFGGPLSDVGVSVKQTNDGGFIIAATTSSFGAGGQDIYLIKTDENGDTLWTKTFGGTGYDKAVNVVQTNDNGYAVFGTTNSFGNGDADFLLWKSDSIGNTEWFKTYGSTVDERVSEGHQLTDGTYILAGDSLGQIHKAWLVKTDVNGNFIWGRTIGSDGFVGRSVQQTNDGGYVICGTHAYLFFQTLVFEFFFSRISSNGSLISARYYGTFLAAWGLIIKKLPDNNLILGGSVVTHDGILERPIILKTDQFGNIIWENILSISQYPAILTSIEPTDDNGFIFTIYRPNITLIKCDENGNLIWEKIVGGPLNDQANSISLINDAGYIVTGETKSFGAGDNDVWLLKFKNNPASEIQVSKDSLHLTFDTTSFTSEDSLIIYNTGSATLNVDTIYSTNASGFLLDVILNDTTIHTSVTSRGNYYNPFEIEPNDSAKLIFTYPLWVPKEFNISETWIDTIIILNNSINNSSLAIHTLIDYPVGVGNEIDNLPATFSLSQNYPNPFNPSTKIKFEIPDQVWNDNRFVTLKVYDVLGNEIATLVNEEKQPGTYEVEFNTSSIKHLPSSGIYFYQIKAGNYTETKKMILLK